MIRHPPPLIAAIFAAAYGVWWLSIPLLMAGIVIGYVETSRRPPPVKHTVTTLRRRQIDGMDEVKR